MKQNKRGNAAFNLINAGMISFLGFMLIVLLTIIMISTMKSTSMVCGTGATSFNGNCVMCLNSSFAVTNSSHCCRTDSLGSCQGTNYSAVKVYDGAAYNATIALGSAAQLPGQFAQIIVIVVIIVGILTMLSMIGYNVYNKMKK